MKPEELLSKLNHVFPYSKPGESVADTLNNIEKGKLKLIQQAKKEWCYQQRLKCGKVYEHCLNDPNFFNGSFTKNEIINAPEPE